MALRRSKRKTIKIKDPDYDYSSVVLQRTKVCRPYHTNSSDEFSDNDEFFDFDDESGVNLNAKSSVDIKIPESILCDDSLYMVDSQDVTSVPETQYHDCSVVYSSQVGSTDSI